ncbi:MAG TPA: response regulator transcription factor [Candidatus Acidoferrales bacterium]|nr:response regulator transcription factor [Candidatus Acidoferrales bacterium]
MPLQQDSEPNLLLVDDDEVFGPLMARALDRRGYAVHWAQTGTQALQLARQHRPSHAVLDLRLLEGESGLDLIEPLRDIEPDMRIVVLTGYASIATAIDAIKLGAAYYLPKPVDADAIVRAFGHAPGEAAAPQAPTETEPLSVRRLEWEYIQRVLAEHGGNISAAARSLKMHRRTLQRKLGKRAVKR